MTTQSDIAELQQQHRALETELAEELAHKTKDTFKITALKRRKLQLTDEIERLQNAGANANSP